MGPATEPPTERLVYCWPSERAAGSVHCRRGASKLSEVLRRMKFEPGPVRMLNCAPLNPPRLTSYGVVTTELETFASRGMLLLPKGEPLRVVAFWSDERPSTEKPAGSPSAPVTGVTPGM